MDTLEAVARSLGALVAVLALVWLIARVMRGRTGGGRAATVQITQRIGLGRRTGVAVVEAGDRRILVGVGDAQVTFLADLGEVGVPAVTGVTSSTVERDSAAVEASPAPRPRVVVREIPDPVVPPQRTPGLREIVVRAQERTLRR